MLKFTGDFKELKKYGFTENECYPNYFKPFGYDEEIDEDVDIYIDIETREVSCSSSTRVFDVPRYFIDDLITAALVVKEGE